jgi:uncharacterized protein (TIGR02231 family)
MKNNFLSLLLFSFFLSSFGSKNEKTIVSEIKDVTIYLNGAQVKRKGNVTLKKGINTLLFQNVSPYLDAKTIQISGLGDYIILDSKKSIFYPKPEEKKEIPSKITAQIAKMRDSVKDLNFERNGNSAKLNHIDTERKYLITNKIYQKDTLPEFSASLSYLRKQLFELTDMEQKLKKQNNDIQELITEINNRITELNNYQQNTRQKTNNPPIHQIEVTVQAQKNLTGSMTISYFVSNASWSPSYDIRVKDINSPVELTMKGTVYQNTGEDWENVGLTLSTNNPYKNKVKPELSVWYINYYNPNIGYYKDANKKLEKSRIAQTKALSLSEIVVDEAEDNYAPTAPRAVQSTNYTVKTQTMANVEYKIDLKYSIAADNKAHLVAVNQQEIKADYIHYLVPKYDKESYLVAQLVDWEELDLLPSKANLYYEGSYIGESRINPTANDTLYISLGNDRNVRIKRVKDKEKSRDKVFSNRKSTTVSYDLIVKNMGIKDYSIVVEDHLPVSKDKTIEVILENKSKANFDEKTGMMVWKFDLKGKGNKKLNYTYKVEYDTDKPLDLSKL